VPGQFYIFSKPEPPTRAPPDIFNFPLGAPGVFPVPSLNPLKTPPARLFSGGPPRRLEGLPPSERVQGPPDLPGGPWAPQEAQGPLRRLLSLLIELSRDSSHLDACNQTDESQGVVAHIDCHVIKNPEVLGIDQATVINRCP
jgi:hypothetical protein